MRMEMGETPAREDRNHSSGDARPAARLWGINVLLVEDDAADTSLILSALQRHPNVSAAHAADTPVLALRQLSSGFLTPNLILLDIHMPRMNGFEFLDELRKLPSMRDTPVVFLTTSGLAKDVVGARWSSALAYVVKPDSFSELQLRLDRVIKRVLSSPP